MFSGNRGIKISITSRWKSLVAAKDLLESNTSIRHRARVLFIKYILCNLLDLDLPYYTTIGLTYDCDCNCEHCCTHNYKSQTKKVLSNSEIKDLIDQLHDLKVALISFFGGEPMLRKDIFDLVEYSTKKRIMTNIETNGQFITLEVARRLKKAGLSQIHISLDSPHQELHDKFRGKKGSYDRALESMKNCVESGIHCTMGVCVSKKNIDDVPDMIKLAKNLSIDGVRLLQYTLSGKWICKEEVALNKKEEEKLKTYLEPGFVTFEGGEYNYGTNERFCGSWRKNKIYISPYGELHPCEFVPYSFGNTREKSIKQLLDEMWGHDIFGHKCSGCVMNNPLFRDKYIKNVSGTDKLIDTSTDKKIYKSKNKPNLKNLPILDRSLFQDKPYQIRNVIRATRGCPHGCDFCSVSSYFGKQIRCRPVKHIVKEIKNILKNSKNKKSIINIGLKKCIFFTDENIIGNKKYAKELFKAMIPLKIRWVSQSCIDIAEDPELLGLARKSGCLGLYIGFESINPKALKNINKNYKSERYAKSIKKIKKKGIFVYGSFIFGLDNEDKKCFKQTLEFCIRNEIDHANFQALILPEGTKIKDKMKKERKIISEISENHLKRALYKPKKMSISELEMGIIKIYEEFYSWKNIVKRSLKYLKTSKKRALALLITSINFKSKMKKGIKQERINLEKFKQDQEM